MEHKSSGRFTVSWDRPCGAAVESSVYGDELADALAWAMARDHAFHVAAIFALEKVRSYGYRIKAAKAAQNRREHS